MGRLRWLGANQIIDQSLLQGLYTWNFLVRSLTVLRVNFADELVQ